LLFHVRLDRAPGILRRVRLMPLSLHSVTAFSEAGRNAMCA
jgi:hypothetical protein